MDEKVEKIIYLIHVSDLDETVKGVLIQTLLSEGLTDYIREQIKAYCLDGIQNPDERTDAARLVLEETPAE